MNKLQFRKGQLSPFMIFIVSIIGIVSLYFTFNGIWMTLGLIFPIVVIVSIQENVEIDLDKRIYRSYMSILWIKPRKWHKLPEGTKVGVRAVKLVSNRAYGLVVMDSKSSENIYELFLYLPNPKKVVLKHSKQFKALYDKAEYIHGETGYEIVVDNRIPKEAY